MVASFNRKDSNMLQLDNMLQWAIIFLIVALVAAFFGFGGLAGTAMSGAKLLFWVAIVLAVVTFIVSLVRRGGE